MEFGIGVIGATGYIGTPYRREIRQADDDATIVAICARRPDLLAQAGREDGAVLVTDQWQEVVEHPDVNLVLVLTPDALHYEPVFHAARLGKHLLCEKPIGIDVQQARAMRDVVLGSGIAHFVPFWTRYVPIFQRAREIIAERRLGEIRAYVYRWHNPRPLSMPFTWRDDSSLSSAGSIADVGSHAYDTVRFMIEEDATKVLAAAQVMMPPKPDLGDINLDEAIAVGNQRDLIETPSVRSGTVPDSAQVVLEYESGLIGTVLVSHASFLRKGFAPELEFHGTKGSLAIDRIGGELWFADSTDPATMLERVEDGPARNRFQQFVFPAIRAQIAGQDSTSPDMNDGYHVQRFTDAAARSAKSGTWISLSEND